MFFWFSGVVAFATLARVLRAYGTKFNAKGQAHSLSLTLHKQRKGERVGQRPRPGASEKEENAEPRPCFRWLAGGDGEIEAACHRPLWTSSPCAHTRAHHAWRASRTREGRRVRAEEAERVATRRLFCTANSLHARRRRLCFFLRFVRPPPSLAGARTPATHRSGRRGERLAGPRPRSGEPRAPAA